MNTLILIVDHIIINSARVTLTRREYVLCNQISWTSNCRFMKQFLNSSNKGEIVRSKVASTKPQGRP